MTNENLNLSNPERNPIVAIKSGKVFANSRDVASFFGKRHDNVIRDIAAVLAETKEWGVLNFEECSYISELQGVPRSYRCYDMTKNGFTYLVQGYTGAKAAAFKIAYIEQFDAMEAELRAQAAAPALPNLSDPVVLTHLLMEHASKRIEAERRADSAERQVVEIQPKAAFYDQFVNADGLYGLQNAARALKQGPNKFIQTLKQGYLFYEGGVLVPKVRFREMGIFEVLCTYVDGKARFQTYVTPKGLTYFAKKLGVTLDGDLFQPQAAE